MQATNIDEQTPCHQMPILRRDDHQKTASDAVSALQAGLQQFGFKSLKTDGFFGKRTEDAVKEFQGRGSDHDPTVTVDGIVGPRTWEALGMCIVTDEC